MKPPPFEYFRPDTIEAAITLLAEANGEAKLLAGGQSLVPMMNFRLASPRQLIDVNRIPGHDYIRREGDELVIGFLARHEDIRRSPLVSELCPLVAGAYEFVAHGPVRNRGTLCGNLCHADPASEMPAVMLACDASLDVRGPSGARRIAAKDFFLGLYETATRDDELLAAVRIPVAPARQGWGFREVSTRKGDFAFVAVGALVSLQGERITSVRLAAAGVGDRAVRLHGAELGLLGQVAGDEAFHRAGAAASAAVTPPGDHMASAHYRRELIDVLTRRALADAASRAT